MEFLRITSAAGVRTWIPESALIQVTTAADSTSAATANAAGRLTRGLITDVKYLDGIAAASPTITVVAAIPPWSGANTLYELICLGPDGAGIVMASNRVTNF
jgi:hypothetical protein